MDLKINEHIRDVTIDYFLGSAIGEKLEKAINIFNRVFEVSMTLYDKNNELDSIGIKYAMMLTFELFKKFAEGKTAKDITPEEWKEIANSISHNILFDNERNYTIYLFDKYESYIRNCADGIKAKLSVEKVESIVALAEQLKEKREQLIAEEITETTYIDDCLWISMEAIIKLLACSVSFSNDMEDSILEEFMWAVSNFAFELGRYTLFKKENEILSQLMDRQYILNEELKNKYSRFIAEVESQSKMFCSMIENAFVIDFKASFLNSIILAQAAGVESDDVLKTEEEIDDFFLD